MIVNKLKTKIGRETLWSFANKTIGFLFYYLIVHYLSTSLGAENYGIWSFFFSIFTIAATILGVGVSSSAKVYIAQHIDSKNFNDYLFSTIITLILTVITGSLIFILFIYLAHNFPNNAIQSDSVLNLLLFSVPFFVAYQLLLYLKNVYKRSHKIRNLFLLSTMQHGSILTLIVLLSVSDAYTTLIAYTIGTSISAILGLFILFKSDLWYNINLNIKGIKKNSKKIRGIFTYSIPLVAITIGYVVMTEIDILMVGILASNTDIGNYALAKNTVGKLPNISAAIAIGVLPIFAHINEENKTERRRLFTKIIGINTALFIPISIFIILAAPTLVPKIFGIEYINAVLPIQILSFYVFLMSYSTYFDRLLDYQGLAGRRALIIVGMIVLNIGFNYILIPIYGSTGAAVGTLLSYIPYVIFTSVFIIKLLYVKQIKFMLRYILNW